MVLIFLIVLVIIVMPSAVSYVCTEIKYNKRHKELIKQLEGSDARESSKIPHANPLNSLIS